MPELIGWDRGSDERTAVEMNGAAVRKAIAYYLSRQGSAEFDPENVSILFNSTTGEVTASALSRRTP